MRAIEGKQSRFLLEWSEHCSAAFEARQRSNWLCPRFGCSQRNRSHQSRNPGYWPVQKISEMKPKEPHNLKKESDWWYLLKRCVWRGIHEDHCRTQNHAIGHRYSNDSSDRKLFDSVIFSSLWKISDLSYYTSACKNFTSSNEIKVVGLLADENLIWRC